MYRVAQNKVEQLIVILYTVCITHTRKANAARGHYYTGVGKLGRSKVGLGKLGLGKLGFGKLGRDATSKSA